MNFEKVIPWTLVVYMVYRPFHFIFDNTAATKMNGIKFMFHIAGWWLLAGMLAVIMILLNPKLNKRNEERKRLAALEIARKEKEEADLQAAPLTAVEPTQTLVRSNEIAYGSVMALLQKGNSFLPGELVVTNQRVIFSGKEKSFAYTLNSLINVTYQNYGVRFSNGSETAVLKIPHAKKCHAFLVTCAKVIATYK